MAEVHAVDAGDQDRGHPDDGHDRECFHDVVLLDADETEHRVEQELHFGREVRLIVVERDDVADLEEHLGTRLLHRTTRRLSLTGKRIEQFTRMTNLPSHSVVAEQAP